MAIICLITRNEVADDILNFVGGDCVVAEIRYPQRGAWKCEELLEGFGLCCDDWRRKLVTRIRTV